MTLEAEVKENGILIVQVPAHLIGKKVFVNIEERTPTDSSWNNIEKILQQADALEIPRKTNKKILQDLKTFRESE